MSSRFNIPIAGSVLDVIWIIVSIVSVAFFFYKRDGVQGITDVKARNRARRPLQFPFGVIRTRLGEGDHRSMIADAQQSVIVERDRAEAVLDAKKAEIRAKEAEITAAEARRDSIDAEAEHHRAEIPQEIDRIQVSRQKAQDLTQENLRLRGLLGTQRDRLRDLNGLVAQLTEQRDDLLDVQAELDDTLFANDQRRLALVRDVEEMIAYRERDPWSMFPVSASLAAYVEVTPDANFLSFSLAKDFYRRGRFDFGVTGALGFGNEQGTSVKEGGVYANYELAFRRASIDFGAGVSSLRIGTDDEDVEPYVSAILRYAPYYRERAFLLLGTKYSHEDLSFLAGVGFGRR